MRGTVVTEIQVAATEQPDMEPRLYRVSDLLPTDDDRERFWLMFVNGRQISGSFLVSDDPEETERRSADIKAKVLAAAGKLEK